MKQDKFQKIITNFCKERRVSITGPSASSFLIHYPKATNIKKVENRVVNPKTSEVRYVLIVSGTIKVFNPIKLEDLIVQLIRTRYTIDEEFAILRQRDIKEEEFQEYFDFVEYCKQTAKDLIKQRNEYLDIKEE